MPDLMTSAGLDALLGTPPDPPRYGVYRRRRGEPWRLVVSVGGESLARQVMLRLMDTQKAGSADWRVGPVEEART